MRDWLGEAKAKQVYLVLRDRILSGAVAFGAKLPNENELARIHGVSRVTVRRALGELERERLIERRRSAGTRVVYRPSPAPMSADISGVLANLADMGRRTAVQAAVVRLCAGGRSGRGGAGRRRRPIAATLGARALGRRPAVFLSHDPCSGACRVTFTRQDLAIAAAARTARTRRRESRTRTPADQRGPCNTRRCRRRSGCAPARR